MRFQYILFDLDGTLSESGRGLTRSIQYALKTCKVAEPELEELESFIGPPLSVEFRRKYGLNDEVISELVEVFRAKYWEEGLLDTNTYPGTVEMLEACKKAGMKMAIATGKPEVMAEKVIEFLGIKEYFIVVSGTTLATADDVNTTSGVDNKEKAIRKALEVIGAADKTSVCAMVGDRKFDISAGIAQGLTPVGVSFGYGGREELLDAGCADHDIADTMEELTGILLRETN